jgi:hypothetical protein
MQNSNRTPDFFLGSSEHRDDWARARACWVTMQLPELDGRASVLVEVEPPVIGQPFGLGAIDIVNLVLAARSRAARFDQPIRFPMPVLIYRLLDVDATGRKNIQLSDMRLSAWGEIYPTMENAERAQHT